MKKILEECYYLKYDHIGCDIEQTYCLGNDCNFKQRNQTETLLRQAENHIKELGETLDEIEKCCEAQNLKCNNIACDILNILNNTKRNNTMNNNESNQKEMQFIYGENKGCTAIYAIDEPSPNNNSYHEFIINYEPDSKTTELLGRIKLQNGNFAEFGHNGIFTEHLLVIARDCLQRFNTSKYACQENSIAINSINNALMWLNKRKTERVKRGVYGTETV